MERLRQGFGVNRLLVRLDLQTRKKGLHLIRNVVCEIIFRRVGARPVLKQERAHLGCHKQRLQEAVHVAGGSLVREPEEFL
jgi:hypothetical protein